MNTYERFKQAQQNLFKAQSEYYHALNAWEAECRRIYEKIVSPDDKGPSK